MAERRLYEGIPLRRALLRALQMAWAADRLRTGVKFLMVLGEAAGWVAEPLGLKLLIDSVVRGDGRGVGTAVVLIIAAHALGLVCDWYGFMVGLRLRESVVLAVDTHVIDLTASAPGIEHLERPDYADELMMLRSERENFATITDAFSGNFKVFVQVGTTVGLLATIHPLLLLLPLFGLPSLVTGARATKVVLAATDERAEVARSGMFTYHLATRAAAGKEIRVFGLQSELQQRCSDGCKQMRRIDLVARLKMTAWNAAGWFVFALGFTAGVGFVALRAAHGDASIGEMVLALSLAGQINTHVRSLVGFVNWLISALRAGRRLVWFEDYVRDARDATTGGTAAPEQLREGVTFEHVAFTYPGTDVAVLTDVNFTIRAGATVAVVGDNGAGKTTLVKLLCRFYEPTSGRILLDGVDLADLDLATWRGRVSAGFQDFVRYEMLLHETVGIGDLPHIADRDRIEAAIAAASADDVVADLPDGADTQLGKSFDGGLELSGGQWQKLALGRAMMQTVPLLLVLDEPTAALDAATEHALFERFASAAHDAARLSGAITLIVSHRFSTVRMADLIIVVEDGRVTEVGNHATLIARAGTYAELYELQAAAYR